MPDRSWKERLLVIVLRIGAVMTLSAFFAMVMPTEWMVAANRRLGLGELADDAIMQYLTRSLSAMYGFHGGLLLVISLNVRSYRGIVTYVGVMNLLFGVCLLGIDLHAGLPAWWTWGEGPSVAMLGVLLLWLVRAVPDD